MSLDFPLDPFPCSGPFIRDVIQLRIKRQLYTQIETVNWICVVASPPFVQPGENQLVFVIVSISMDSRPKYMGRGHITWGAEQGFVPTTQSVFVVCGFNVCIFSVAKS